LVRDIKRVLCLYGHNKRAEAALRKKQAGRMAVKLETVLGRVAIDRGVFAALLMALARGPVTDDAWRRATSQRGTSSRITKRASFDAFTAMQMPTCNVSPHSQRIVTIRERCDAKVMRNVLLWLLDHNADLLTTKTRRAALRHVCRFGALAGVSAIDQLAALGK